MIYGLFQAIMNDNNDIMDNVTNDKSPAAYLLNNYQDTS